MNAISRIPTLALAGRCAVCVAVALAFAPAARAEKKIDFNRDIRPILSANCFHCHGPDPKHREADLRLDTEEGSLADLGDYAAIVPGKPEESALVERIESDDVDMRMPPEESNKHLTAPQKKLLVEWIEQGAEYAKPWTYAKPVRHPLPEVKNKKWPRNFIDVWILSRLEAEGLAPSPEADRLTLIRRLSFDLTGLPPTPSEVDAFEADKSPEAYEKLVDRLLASPHFGERMAVWWLDLVRFADTVGYHGDQTHRVWPYRDYVIRAFNSSKPFDRFVVEQLAGDLLPNAEHEQLVATCYNRLLQTSHEGGAQLKEYRAIYMADRVRNFSQVFMGATIGCAQCHDHKFDPYTARDFYSLGAFFADVEDEEHLVNQYGGLNTLPTRRLPEIDVPASEEQARQFAPLEAELKAAQQKFNSAPANGKPQAKAALDAATARVNDAKKTFARVMYTKALATPRVVRILPRGNWLDETGEIVQPAVPVFLGKLDTANRRASRLDLANWLFAAEEAGGIGGIGGLTARVEANRLWKLLMGVGIARVLDDFGGQGEPPVHPELLDSLAVEFVDGKWDVKHLVKTIVMSQTYRQSSVMSKTLAERDPDNRLYARQSRPRLEAEFIRDNALAISGLLVRDMGGPSVYPYQPPRYYSHLNFPKREYAQHNDARQWRRGVYVHWQRQFLHPMMKAFDAPTREECAASRSISNIPTQALVLLNDPTFVEAARALAGRVLGEGGDTDAARFQFAYLHAVGRSPNAEEVALLAKLLNAHRKHFAENAAEAKATQTTGLTKLDNKLDPVELAAWTSVARAVLNLSETNTRN